MDKINLDELKVGDIFSEISHYTFVGKNSDGTFKFEHHESGETVNLTEGYVSNLLSSANVYSKELVVGKEDKKWTARQIEKAVFEGKINQGDIQVGDIRVKGIRTIWEEIHSQTVFTVAFRKKAKTLSNRKLNELREDQLNNAINLIEEAARQKKGVTRKAKEVIKALQENPIIPIEEGDLRVLSGFKLQYDSRDGRYKCMDMAINEPRPVNINTIEWLIFKGVKYIVK